MTIADEIRKEFAWVDGHADVWRLFLDARLLARIVDALAEPFAGDGVTVVAGIEGRGFVLAPAVALRLEAGFAAIRKPGTLFPGPKVDEQAAADYRGHSHTLSMQRAAAGRDDVVLLVDDWAENGAQALAAKALVERLGARFAGVSLIVDQLTDDVRASLGRVHALVSSAELPADEVSA